VKTGGENTVETVKLRNHHLSLSIWPEGGRILEAQSLRTGRGLLSWWPHRMDSPRAVGGIGDLSLRPGAPACKCRRDEGGVTLTGTLPGEIALERRIVLAPDSLVFSVTVSLANNSESARTVTLEEGAAVCPGAGGACPGPASGISNSRERAFIKRRAREPETIYYEVFQRIEREHDDPEWVAFGDPVYDHLLCVILPPGHVRITTDCHWWLEWSEQFEIAPGGRVSVDFHYAAVGDLDLPLLACEHVVAGFKGGQAPLEKEAKGAVLVWGLDDAAAGNEVAVKADGRELVGGKPMPPGRKALEVELPQWRSAEGLALEVSVAGKFGQARLEGCRCPALYRELDALCSQAAADAEASKISRTKAATVMAFRELAQVHRGKCAEVTRQRLEEAFNGACAVLESTHEAVPLYSESERRTIERLASNIDMERAAETARERLRRDFDLEAPRFREPDSSLGAAAAADALLEAALVLSVHEDEELLDLFRKRLAELTGLWRTFGQIRYESIHHGVLLCKLIPACKLAFEGGWLDLETEAGAQAMLIDLCAKIRRRGGRQFRLSNWWAPESAAPAWLGALFPYVPDAAEYRNAARESLYWLLVHGTLADGGFWEMSPGYHFLTLTYLHQIAEALLRTGEDLYQMEICGRHLADMTGYLKALACPGGAVPAFDDSGRSLGGATLLALAKRLHDGELLFHAKKAFERAGRACDAWDLYVPLDAPEPSEPKRSSEVLVPSGKLILRSACRSLTFIFDFGPHGGWHGHSDKLSFEAFWRDRCIVPDAGSYRYEDSLHWSWFKTSAAHNTVTIGDADRVHACGRLLYFEEGRGFVTAGMSAPLSESSSHRREVTLSDRALIIDDFVENAREGEILTWRMNSYAPVEIRGDAAVFSRDGVKVRVTPVSQGVAMEVAEVPLMGEEESPTSEYVTGFQLRLSRPVEGDSQRILVRLDFSW